jgi:adenylyltransferase/sulfurtransferase
VSAATGSLAALEAIKILAGMGKPLFGKLWTIDAHQGHTSMVDLARDPNCPVCGKK